MSSPVPSTSISRVRDYDYYFEDGSIIFLVENTLFKIQRSLLTSQSEVFRDMFELPKQSNTDTSTSPNAEGASDDNPIIIPDVRAAQFRHFLLYFYGTITNPDYRSLILDATDESSHLPDAFIRYLHIVSLSHRFCMEPVEFWALEQFNRVLQSTEKLALEFWDDSGELLEALRYSKLLASREVERNVRNLIQYYVYRLEVDPGSDSQFKSDPEHFIRLYKDPVLKKEDPALFGYTFCALLRAEQDSALWKCLTRDERLQLFAALVYLTPLPSTLPTSWIQHTSEVSEAVNTDSRNGCFDACAKSFLNHFSNGLTCSKLNSDSLRSGVAEVLELADRRLSLERKFRSAECTCAEQLLEVVDLNMNTLFAEITEKYHGCLE